jgi:hypothetical protein
MSNYFPTGLDKKRDGVLYYYGSIVVMLILLPLWLPFIILIELVEWNNKRGKN